MRFVALGVWVVFGCGGPAAHVQPTVSAQPADARPADAPSRLQISFHPGFTHNLGWSVLDEEVPLDALGSPRVKHVNARFGEARAGWAESLRSGFARQLSVLPLADTSLSLDEEAVCGTELREAVRQQEPTRLLIAIEGGINKRVVSCLSKLGAAPIFLRGCLHRPHRRNDVCDGDAELRALADSAEMRERVQGLAASLSTVAAVMQLGALPNLEYLALVSGRDPEGLADFHAVPWHQLKQLRFLDIKQWQPNESVRPIGPHAMAAIARLDTLRWNGDFLAPLPSSCRLRRLSDSRLGDRDVQALAACTQLHHVSTDDVGDVRASSLAQLTKLRRLHLRHWRVTDLTPLARLRELRRLSLPGSKASDFSVLGSLDKLEWVDLSQSGLETLDAFEGQAALSRLDVGFTKVSNLTPLAGCASLHRLDLHDTGVEDIAVLGKLRQLTRLTLSKTAVSDLKPLRDHPTLERLSLRQSKVTDASVLFTLPKLRRAHVGRLSLPQEQLERLKKLPNLDLNLGI